jgi:Rrf2 family protein
MFRVNRQTDYAIRVLLDLARQPAGTRRPTRMIGKEMNIPGAFLPRIVAQLAQAGLLLTFQGRDGGLELPRPAQQITLRQIVEAVEGPLVISECMLGEQTCPFEDACPVQTCWVRVQEVFVKELERTTLANLARHAGRTSGPQAVLPGAV